VLPVNAMASIINELACEYESCSLIAFPLFIVGYNIFSFMHMGSSKICCSHGPFLVSTLLIPSPNSKTEPLASTLPAVCAH
jgi:hypothetical protein